MIKFYKKIFKIRYLLILFILSTLLFTLIKPEYLYKNKEFFSTSLKTYGGAHQFYFLPESSNYDVVTLCQDSDATRIVYRNLGGKGYKEIYLTGIGMNNLSFGHNVRGNIYSTEDKVYTILANKGSYYLYELYSENNFDYNPKAVKFFEYNLYNDLLKKELTIKGIKFGSINFQNTNIDFFVQKSPLGHHLYLSKTFYKKIFSTISKEFEIHKVSSNDDFIKFKSFLSNEFNCKFETYDIIRLLEFFPRNNYYKKKFFSKVNSENYGFLMSRIVGEIDANMDGNDDLLITIDAQRWANSLLIAYDVTNETILWEKEYTTEIQDCVIQDIDNDNINDILISTYAPGMEMNSNRFVNFKLANSLQSFFAVLDVNGNIKKVNTKPLFVKMSKGFYKTEFVLNKENNFVVIGLGANFDPSDKKLLRLNYKSNVIDTLNISYQNIIGLRYKNDMLELFNSFDGNLSLLTINEDFKIVKSTRNNIEYNYLFINDDIELSNNFFYHLRLGLFLNADLDLVYEIPYKMKNAYFKIVKNNLYFINKGKHENYNLCRLHFVQNRALNPYIIILFLAEFLLLLFYFLIKQYINIPLKSATSNYFIIFNYFGKLYYWKLVGRLQNIYKLPKKLSTDIEVPDKILNDISEENELIYKKNLFIFKYKVYEIQSRDESEIIQRISHNLKNQVLMMKLLTDQYADRLSTQNKTYIEEVSSSLKIISSVAQTLSNFSHIDKLYKEEVEFNSFIEQLIISHINHNLFENINYKPYAKQIMIKLDENLFRIAFDNLINNALDEIEVEESINVIIDRKDNKIIFRISNPYHEEKKDISEFGKVGFSTKSEGSGIGLPISKVIIEKHKGNLEYFTKDKLFIVEISLPYNEKEI